VYDVEDADDYAGEYLYEEDDGSGYAGWMGYHASGWSDVELIRDCFALLFAVVFGHVCKSKVWFEDLL